MHSRFQDLVPVHLKDEGDPELDRPSEEDIEEVQPNFTNVFTVTFMVSGKIVKNMIRSTTKFTFINIQNFQQRRSNLMRKAC